MSKVLFGFWMALMAAIPWVADSAFLARSVASAYYLGRFLPRDDRLAVRWYGKAARQGDGQADYNLGLLYYSGTGVETSLSAAYWWRQGAENGNVYAQSALGDAYCLGLGIAADEKEARRWWRLARQQGDRHASEMLQNIDCFGRPKAVRPTSDI